MLYFFNSVSFLMRTLAMFIVYQRVFDLYSFFMKNKELNIVLQFVVVFHWISSFETC